MPRCLHHVFLYGVNSQTAYLSVGGRAVWEENGPGSWGCPNRRTTPSPVSFRAPVLELSRELQNRVGKGGGREREGRTRIFFKVTLVLGFCQLCVCVLSSFCVFVHTHKHHTPTCPCDHLTNVVPASLPTRPLPLPPAPTHPTHTRTGGFVLGVRWGRVHACACNSPSCGVPQPTPPSHPPTQPPHPAHGRAGHRPVHSLSPRAPCVGGRGVGAWVCEGCVPAYPPNEASEVPVPSFTPCVPQPHPTTTHAHGPTPTPIPLPRTRTRPAGLAGGQVCSSRP